MIIFFDYFRKKGNNQNFIRDFNLFFIPLAKIQI